jgi:predicted ATPase
MLNLQLFKDAVMTLLPSLEDFEPVEIDLKEKFSFNNDDEKLKLPLDFPEKIYDIRVKEKNNNQQTSITSLSSGSQKIFYVVSVAIAAEINKVPLITYEELENSIHPGLLQKLLIILDNLLEHSKILLSSHSPYLIQYLDFSNIKIGTPNEKGLAIFKQLRKTKFNKLLLLAEDENISVGDLIFEKMIECQSSENDFFNEMCS